MKIIVSILVLLGLQLAAHGQSLKKYPVSNSGCSVYNYCTIDYELNYSDDSSKVYTGECADGGVTYGVICVKLSEPAEMIDAEPLTEQYLNYLKKEFEVESSVGYGKGNRLKGDENTRGLVDYWVDKKGNNIKIKGWTNGNYIVVLYASTQKELPEAKANVFLDSLVFP